MNLCPEASSLKDVDGRSERSKGGDGVIKGKSAACGDMCNRNDGKSSGGRHCDDRGVG